MTATKQLTMRGEYDAQHRNFPGLDWFTWQIAWTAAALPSDAAQEPVAVIGSGWQLLYASREHLAAIVERHGLKIGAKLYAAPVAPAAAAPEPDARSHMKEGRWCPDECPITGLKFFMWLDHPELGYVPTYGGPFDSYTLALLDEDGLLRSERYDHDAGWWVEGGEPMTARDELIVAAEMDGPAAAPTLAVNADDLDFTPDERHAISDMANIGKALLEIIASMCPDYAWNDSPTEIVSDLINERDDERANYDRIRHGLARWATERWNDEVRNRPLINVHRRALDDTWRQVIRYCGADDVAMLGPKHSDLVAAAPAPAVPADAAAPSDTCACGYSLETSCNVLDPTCKRNAAQPDERAAFEAWAHGKSYTLARDDQGANPYANCLTVCAWEAWQARATAPQATVNGDERRPAKSHCQNGGDVCLAGNRDGVCCPEDSCDIDDGVRTAPFQNCSFRHCDLPGQCKGEGACHHPARAAVPQAGVDAGDAARYRWLRRQAVASHSYDELVCRWEVDYVLRGDSFDAAIDAARAGGEA